MDVTTISFVMSCPQVHANLGSQGCFLEGYCSRRRLCRLCHYLGSSCCSSLALRDAVFCCGHLSFRLSYGLCKYGVREKHGAVAYRLLIFFPTNPHMTSWAHCLGAPKPSPHSLCCVSKPLVSNEFHFLSQLVFSWLRPYASFSSATTPNRRRPARSSRSLLGLQFFWHFRLKRRIAMPAVPDQRSRRVCSACACVFVFCVREQSQASHT